MNVLVTGKYKKDRIKSNREKVETPFPHYKSMGAFCCHWRASNSKVSSLIRPEIKLVRAFMPVLVTSNFDDDSIKNERGSMDTAFSHYKSMGNF